MRVGYLYRLTNHPSRGCPMFGHVNMFSHEWNGGFQVEALNTRMISGRPEELPEDCQKSYRASYRCWADLISRNLPCHMKPEDAPGSTRSRVPISPSFEWRRGGGERRGRPMECCDSESRYRFSWSLTTVIIVLECIGSTFSRGLAVDEEHSCIRFSELQAINNPSQPINIALFARHPRHQRLTVTGLHNT